MSERVEFSLVVPAYNEREVIGELLARAHKGLVATSRTFEMIVIDDGSTDGTGKLLEEAMEERPWLRVIRLAANGGQSAAFDAGFKAARGEIIGTIDADLQNDPEEIARLLPMLGDCDMITGWRQKRQDSGFRRVQTRIANAVRNWISRETIHDSACSLKMYKRHCLEGIYLFNGAHRFMPTLVKMRGFMVKEVPVKHSPRFAGTAKYGMANRAWRGFVDLLGVRWLKMRAFRYQAVEIKKCKDF